MDLKKPHFFIALYSGRTISQATIIAASTDAELIEFATQRMGLEQESPREPVIDDLETRRLSALRLIRGKNSGEASE